MNRRPISRAKTPTAREGFITLQPFTRFYRYHLVFDQGILTHSNLINSTSRNAISRYTTMVKKYKCKSTKLIKAIDNLSEENDINQRCLYNQLA